MSLPRYPHYSSTGMDVPAMAPSNWPITRLRFLAELNPSKSEIAELPGTTPVTFLPMEAIGEDGSLSLEQVREVADVQTGYTYMRDGDVAFAKITPCFENGKGAVMRELQNGIAFGTTELIVARPRSGGLISEYLHYVFSSRDFRQLGEARMYGAGGQKRVPDAFVRDFTWPFPSRDEQRTIVSFLDRETAKIDALVAEKERLMTLLKEKRQSVISQGVTKGLNPDAPMKASGVESLGDVPAHWAVRRLKTLLSLPLQYGANEAADAADLLHPRFIRITDITEGGSLRDDTFRSLPPEIAEPYLLADGDVLLARSGATVGKSFTYSKALGAACFAGYLIRVRFNRDVCRPRWFELYTQTEGYWHMVVGTQIQATIPNVSAEKYANLWLPVPSVQEQDEIIHDLSAKLAQFADLTAGAEKAVSLLLERRAALISAAVTGQIDVRHLATADAA